MNANESHIRLEKCLELRNLVIDKIILSLIVASVVLAGHFGLESYKSTKAMEVEAYKETQSERKALLQNRLNALFELRKAHSKMDEDLYKLIFEVPNDDRHQSERAQLMEHYKADLSSFIHAFNKWGALFSDELDLSLQYHASVHQAFAYSQVPFSPDYYELMMEMGIAFERLTRTALHEEGFGSPVVLPSNSFQPLAWTRQQMLLGAEAYFQANWTKWLQERMKEIQSQPAPGDPR
jgi:hypothetical protein